MEIMIIGVSTMMSKRVLRLCLKMKEKCCGGDLDMLRGEREKEKEEKINYLEIGFHMTNFRTTA